VAAAEALPVLAVEGEVVAEEVEVVVADLQFPFLCSLLPAS